LFDARGQCLVFDTDAPLISGIWRDRQAQLERVSCLQIYGALCKPGNADFRPLQVRQNSDVTTVMPSLSSDVLGDLDMI
jgi:hypothetical protein